MGCGMGKRIDSGLIEVAGIRVHDVSTETVIQWLADPRSILNEIRLDLVDYKDTQVFGNSEQS